MKTVALLATAISAIALVAPASATVWHFELTSPDPTFPEEYASFDIDSATIPDYFLSGVGLIYDDVPGTFSYEGFDSASSESVIFYNENAGGGFMTSDYIITAAGAQLYSGDESAPFFLTGTYALTDFITGQALSLTISDGTETGAVPEPASWAMMLGGFGMIGGALRRRQRTAVSFG